MDGLVKKNNHHCEGVLLSRNQHGWILLAQWWWVMRYLLDSVIQPGKFGCAMLHFIKCVRGVGPWLDIPIYTGLSGATAPGCQQTIPCMRKIVLLLHHVDVPVFSPLAQHTCAISMDGFPMQSISLKTCAKSASGRASADRCWHLGIGLLGRRFWLMTWSTMVTEVVMAWMKNMHHISSFGFGF